VTSTVRDLIEGCEVVLTIRGTLVDHSIDENNTHILTVVDTVTGQTVYVETAADHPAGGAS
jgi:hypothetical protein